jgi:hypothetical protein
VSYLRRNQIKFHDNRQSPNQADFILRVSGHNFHLEVKEKRQRINTSNWPKVDIPEEHLFIIDELTARRLLIQSPYAGVLVRDNLAEIYVYFDIIALWLIPKTRVNRVLNERGQAKGKWMIDLRNGDQVYSVQGGLGRIYRYVQESSMIVEMTECYGEFEDVPTGGELRTREHRQKDYAATR